MFSCSDDDVSVLYHSSPPISLCPRKNSARIRKKRENRFLSKEIWKSIQFIIDPQREKDLQTGLKTGLYSPWHNGVSLRIWTQKKLEKIYGFWFILYARQLSASNFGHFHSKLRSVYRMVFGIKTFSPAFNFLRQLPCKKNFLLTSLGDNCFFHFVF
jgi:hypothetical protein